MFKKLYTFLFLLPIVFFAFFLSASFSFASTFYLSPRSSNIPVGSVVSVSVGINTTGESINAVSAYLSYPSDKLEVAWISYGGSFPLQAEGSYGGGSIKISRGSISGVVGSVNVATIGLRGKSLGSAAVSFVGGSAAARTSDSSDSLNLGGSAGGNYTVGPASSKPTSQTPASKPVISNIVVSELTTNSATISWTTDKDSDSIVEYGLNSEKYYQEVSDKIFTKTHKIVVGENLIPGEKFYFRVKSKDKAGNEAVGNESTFNLKGYIVKIKLQDALGRSLSNTQVTLYSDPVIGKTNQNGEVTFLDVSPGKHLTVIKLNNGFEATREIIVKEDALGSNFNLTIEMPAEKTNFSSMLIGAAALIILVLLGLMVLKRKRGKNQNTTTPPSTPSL